VFGLFEETFIKQLEKLVTQELRITVGEELYIGQLLSVDQFTLTLQETAGEYEREMRKIKAPISQVNYVQVDINQS